MKPWGLGKDWEEMRGNITKEQRLGDSIEEEQGRIEHSIYVLALRFMHGAFQAIAGAT